MPTTISVVIPLLNEIDSLASLQTQIVSLQAQGAEVILVDGGSHDGSREALRAAGFDVLQASPGRGQQLKAGVQAARHEVLLFLHADTRLPDDAVDQIFDALLATRRQWGRFDIRLVGRSRWLPLIATMINLRSRITGIATGDQGMFMTRRALEDIGGIPQQPLMEDLELSYRLRRLSRPCCLGGRAETSGRRWDRYGTWKTILLMWRLRWLYWRGVPADRLARMYP